MGFLSLILYVEWGSFPDLLVLKTGGKMLLQVGQREFLLWHGVLFLKTYSHEDCLLTDGGNKPVFVKFLHFSKEKDML